MKFLKDMIKHWNVRRTMSALNKLDRKTLRDIGITRGEIYATARKVNGLPV